MACITSEEKSLKKYWKGTNRHLRFGEKPNHSCNSHDYYDKKNFNGELAHPLKLTFR